MTAFANRTERLRTRSEGPDSADSVEKHRIAGAESGALYTARTPFLSGLPRLL